jgi:hypothetical protein
MKKKQLKNWGPKSEKKMKKNIEGKNKIKNKLRKGWKNNNYNNGDQNWIKKINERKCWGIKLKK